MHRRFPRIALACSAGLVLALTAAAHSPGQWRLVGSDTAQGDEFGFANGIDGDTVVVGAPYDDSPSGFRSGQAYVFVRDGSAWTEQQRLVALDRSANAQFGTSVDVSGDIAVCGAMEDRGAAPEAGAAYVYVRSGTNWQQQKKLVAGDPGVDDHFGEFVAIDGTTIVVGARLDDERGGDAGAAYVFVRSGTDWVQQQKLTAGDAGDGDHFGISVAIEGDTVVVGAPFAGPQNSGAAYVFTRSGSTWSQQAKIVQADVRDQGFGYDVELSGSTILVGAPDRDTGTTDPGAAYFFTGSGASWTQQQRVLQGDPGAHDRFGRCVALDGDIAVIAAPLDDQRGENAGAVYVFTRTGGNWSQLRKVTASDAQEGAKFGLFVSMDGTTAVAGAPLHGNPAEDSGSAYVLDDVAHADSGGGGGGDPPVVADSFFVPKKVVAKGNGKTTVVVMGTLDTGSVAPNLVGAAQVDVGGINLAVTRLKKRGRVFTFSARGARFAVIPSAQGSSRATFTFRGTGAADAVARDGPVTLHFRSSTVDAQSIVNLESGMFLLGKARGDVVEPPLFVMSASAGLGGAGSDSLTMTLGFADGGGAPAAMPDVGILFGGLDVTIPGPQFSVAGDVATFTGNVGGVTRVVVDYAKGMITAQGSGLTLGDFVQGGNAVTLGVHLGADEREVRVRMARKGNKLKY